MKKTTVRIGFNGFVKLALLAVVFGAPGFALAAPPACLSENGSVLAVNNSQVLQWKTSTANQFLARAHVTGIVQKVYPNETGHNHFSIALDSGPGDTLEVIYNIEFGALPNMAPGMQVEACGDYITSDQVGGGYQPSPDGAIIHWIHATNSAKHEAGYVAINGVTYGQSSGNGNSSND
jgi:hypothetical protein